MSRRTFVDRKPPKTLSTSGLVPARAGGNFGFDLGFFLLRSSAWVNMAERIEAFRWAHRLAADDANLLVENSTFLEEICASGS